MKVYQMINARKARDKAKGDEISPRLKSINRRIKWTAKFKRTFIVVKGLTQDEVNVLKELGYIIKMRTRFSNNKIVVVDNQYIIEW